MLRAQTIEAPPTTVEQEDICTKEQIQGDDGMDIATKSEKDTVAIVEKEVEEPTLNIQIENPYGIKTGEDLMPASATEDKPKHKGLFNIRFSKGGPFKKDSFDEVTATIENAGSESKITKGFGNFLSKVKQTTSSNNIKELSEPAPTTTTAVLAEGETVEEEEQEITTTDTEIKTLTTIEATLPTAEQSSNSNKRQSILNKLFGVNSGANKKKEDKTNAEAKDQTEVENKEQQTEGEESTASSSTPV